MTIFSKNIIISSLLLIFVFCITNLNSAQASYNFANESGLNKTADSAGYSSGLKNLTPETIASGIVSQILAFLGVVFLGLIIYGGISWMTAGGNESKVDTAREIIIGAIIGLIIVLVAYALSYFIINFFSTKSLK